MSNYATDLFGPIFDEIQRVTGARPYTDKVCAGQGLNWNQIPEVDPQQVDWRVLLCASLSCVCVCVCWFDMA